MDDKSEILITVKGGAAVNAGTEVGFKYMDPVVWTCHREYGVGLYIFGLLGVAFVLYDKKRAGIGGSLVLISELERA